jgi:hypothetical protein
MPVAAIFSEGLAIFSERKLAPFGRHDCRRGAVKREIHCKTRRMRAANGARGAMHDLLTKAAG